MKRLSLVSRHPQADRVEYLEGNSRRSLLAMIAGDCGGVLEHGTSGNGSVRNLGDPPPSWFACEPSRPTERTILREADATVEVGLAHRYSERGKAAYMGKGRGRVRLGWRNTARTHGDGKRCQHN